MADNVETIIRTEDLCKFFGSTKAIVDVSFEIKKGEVRGLIGENGSGKSTLSSMIAGIHNPTSGKMFYKGQPHNPKSLTDAKSVGICMLFQEMGTINGLTVWENIFLGREDMFSKVGHVKKDKLIAAAREALDAVELYHIDPTFPIDYYSFEDRKLIEVASMLYNNPDLLIVDETTTALSQGGRESIYKIIAKCKSEGKTVIIISHDIQEVQNVCDSITVLRDGHFVGTIENKGVTEDQLRSMMIGRDMVGHYYREDQKASHLNEVALEVRNVTYGERVVDISFDLYKGEILGIGGLTESGMHELCKVIFGALPKDNGSVKVVKSGTLITSPAVAIENKIAYMPKNRDQESLMLNEPIIENVVLPSFDALKVGGLINRKKEKSLTREYTARLEVKMRNIYQNVKELSGGNKQKVVVAKWLANGSEIYIMDCPTRGIDVGVKARIYDLMSELKAEGKSIIMVSEEMPELIGMSDRIIILKDGKISGELLRDEGITEDMLIQHII